PLYLLYSGWAAALLDVASTAACLWLSGLACGAFVLGSLLATHKPFSGLQTMLLAEHALLLLIGALGISGINIYIKYTKSSWEAERCKWDGLRQVVFSQLSHELYTPLSAISASAALAVEDLSVVERQQRLLRVIERNCARMNMLIDDLLALWKEPQRQLRYAPRYLACLPVVESVGQMLSPLLEGKQQRLVVAAEPQRVSALADKDRLEQVLVNLLVNAHKYAPPEAVITLTINGQGHDVLFAVHDEGAGVPLEEQGHLFELFYRGARNLASSRGSGLGLALAKALVVLQGGRIWVESLPGSGSTFYFTLPAAE
ncbi:MAG TPA: HAMP domain-containing sensor histidine kinase, partial [Ktedonobacterales bacterium]|nr:HAMP domain-containing sensor histidine kinase [Ktedonobacterales bacterium]